MKTVVITGVSRGLGRELLLRVVERGHFVVAIGRRIEDACRSPRVRFVERDLGSPELEREGFTLDACVPADATGLCVVSNAGLIEPLGAVGELDPGMLAHAMRVNVLAPMLLINESCALAARRSLPLRVFNVSSGAAHRPIAGWAAYCAAKSALSSFVAVLSAEGTEATSHDPGVLDTDMQRSLRDSVAAFPAQPYFRELHRSGQLRSASAAAEHLLIEWGI